MIYGSGGIVSALAPKGLIDDYRIFVAPVVLGKGKSLFSVDAKISLKLLETMIFRGADMVMLRYLSA